MQGAVVDLSATGLKLALEEMNGEQLAAAIKERVATCPVILLTGFEDYGDETGSSPTNIDLIVRKPASLEELRRAILEVLSPARVELVPA